MKKVIVFVGVVTILVVFGIYTKSHAGVEIGKDAPNFKLTDTYKSSQALSDFEGKYVVLEWVNHDCPFVLKHYNSGNMQGLQKNYTEKGVTWLSIGSSAEGKQGYFSPEIWNQLTQKKEASPSAVLLDSKGKVGKQYGAKTTPHMYVIDPEGVLIYQGAIDSVRSADPADIANATNYVQMALDQSMAGEEVENPSTKSYGCSVKY